MGSIGTTPVSSRAFRGPGPLTLAALGAAGLVGLVLAVNPMLGFGAFFAVLFVPLILINLPLAASVWVAGTFVDNHTVGVTLLAIGIALAWIGTTGRRRELSAEVFSRHRVLFGAAIGLLLWSLVSTTWADQTAPSFDQLPYLAGAVAAFIVLTTSISSEKHLVWVCTGFVVGAVLSVALAPFVEGSVSTGDGLEEAGRFAGTLSDPNYLAAGLIAGLALAAGLARIDPPRKRLILILVAITLVSAAAATGSRGGVISALAVVAAAILIARRNRLGLAGVSAAGLVVVCLATAVIAPDSWNRLRDFSGGGTGRTDLWIVAWRAAEDNPIVGVGANNFPNAAVDYVTRPGSLESRLVLENQRVAHNMYLQQFAETGVIGISLLLTFALGSMRATWQGVRRLDRIYEDRLASLGRTILLAQVAMLVGSFFISNLVDERWWALMALGPILLTVAIGKERGDGLGPRIA